MIILVLAIVIPVVLLWWFLDWREKKRIASGLPRHSVIRLFFATVAILTTLFCGGCGAFFLSIWIADGMPKNGYVTWDAVAILSLPPFLVGIFIWWLSMRRGNG